MASIIDLTPYIAWSDPNRTKGTSLNPLTKKSLSDNFLAEKLEIRLHFSLLR